MLTALDGPKLRFAAANAAYRAVYPNLELGASVWDLLPDLVDQHLYEQFVRVYETGEPLSAREWRMHVDLDGAGTKELFFDMVVTPRRDAGGTIIGVLISLDEVTGRVRARRAVEVRAERLQDRYEAVRDAATVMQQALLSPAIPVLPHLDVAAAYLVATEDTGAGGDWFDVLPGADGGVHLVVGDVVGHGVRAAAVMAQLRTAVRMQLHAGAGIVEALDAVDDFAAEIPGAASATLCLARVDPDSGDVEYCTAGHPPPLVVGVDGSARYLEPTNARPLRSGSEYLTRSTHLEDGDVIALYSDGLIERPGLRLPASTAEVADVAARVLHGTAGFVLDAQRAPVQRLCSQAVEVLVRATGYADDITLLAAQRRPASPALNLDVAADEHAEPQVRARLRAWFDTLGADFVSGQILEHAVTEFVANAVEHAYGSTDSGTVAVRGVLDDGGFARVSVSDHGRWRDANGNDPRRGRGLSLAQAMVADTSVVRSPTGTTVTAVHRLTRDAHIVVDPRAARTAPPNPATTFNAVVEDDGVVIVAGDVDSSAAAALDGILSIHSHAGTAPVTVDLSAVTHFGSAAVGVLIQTSRRAHIHGSSCTLLAPPGGTAHHVLSLAGLPTGPAETSPVDD
ncbi:SpoIIE family protein phosphatase [Mycobacterium yunnanensis]|uniref:SpoIIE family protein phosphatase n=2 Tax=Mycobacterium yunnanensis TaxID=368477 RepID=A0A9X3C0U1_9MYCO|nr:SpoIIE family protein phosphatase [Mycobacterium yunnanensis]